MTIRLEKDVMVPMRDDVLLATDLWIPEGGPAPVLLVRLPYGKDIIPGDITQPTMPNLFSLLEAGYAVAWQDCRGTFRSGGEFEPIPRPQDGADTIAWLRNQPWCNGDVGAYGHSYLGMVQWSVAAERPEGLKAIAPTETTTDYYVSPWYSEGGALSWHTLWSWTALMTMLKEQTAADSGRGDLGSLMEVVEMISDPTPHLARLPLKDQPLFARTWPWWPEFLDHASRDSYWRSRAIAERPERVAVPALNVGGWFDLFVTDTARTFTEMRRNAGTTEAREGQRLVIGPWDHLSFTGTYHDRQFGVMADIDLADLTSAHIAFFDRYVRGDSQALAGVSPVRIFVMGIDEWRDEQDWPLPDTTYTDYYLDGKGLANTETGDGVLSTSRPEMEAADYYDYDPRNPVPTLGGRTLGLASLNGVGPVDQRPVESRDDVLCFTTPPLDQPVDITGHVSLVLHVASSAPDTDFTGKLVDVFPDGRAIYLTDGVLRTRYRQTLAEPTLLDPGTVYELTLDLSVTSNVFLPGHRIRLEVSSSNFPRYDRNTNTGTSAADCTADDLVVAHNRVLHGPQYLSRLVLPVIRR